MKIIKNIFTWLFVCLIGIGAPLITVFCFQPLLIPRLIVYAEYCLDRSEYRGVTPDELDAIMQKEPGDWYELHDILYHWSSIKVPRKGSHEWAEYTEALDREASFSEYGEKVKQWNIHWYPGANPHEHRYTEVVTARTLFQAAVNSVDWNGSKAGTECYFLLDKDLRILGWAKEFNGCPSW